MGKNKIRSIRLSEEIEEVINQQIGSNFTEKLINLITRCVFELPYIEEKLKQYDDLIKQRRETLNNIDITWTEYSRKIQKIERAYILLEKELDAIINEYANTNTEL